MNEPTKQDYFIIGGIFILLWMIGWIEWIVN